MHSSIMTDTIAAAGEARPFTGLRGRAAAKPAARWLWAEEDTAACLVRTLSLKKLVYLDGQFTITGCSRIPTTRLRSPRYGTWVSGWTVSTGWLRGYRFSKRNAEYSRARVRWPWERDETRGRCLSPAVVARGGCCRRLDRGEAGG
jgi:hypothetical protein